MADRRQSAQDKEQVRHHRVAGLAITPIMDQLGFATKVEMDISIKSQLIDIICVRRERVVAPSLPPIYWEIFGELNEHNLISFKSYSESFNARALEEFYGHLTNYCKVENVKREQVNLYVFTHHYPRDLLEPLCKAGQVQIVHENDVYDLAIGNLQRVRFIICSRTDNPVLALFSNDVDKILGAYTTLRNEPMLFDDMSIYWQQILKHIGKEIKNMYTMEDFLRDYPPTDDDEPGLFEWYEELREQVTEQVTGQITEQSQKAERVAMIIQLLERRFETVSDEIHTRLEACTLDQLQELVNPALDAPDLDTFLSHIPESDVADKAADNTGNLAAETSD